MNDELLAEIKSLLPWVIVAALAVGGYYGVKNHLAAKRAAATQAAVESYTVDEFEEAAAKFDSAAPGGAIKLRLAKKLFDEGRYQEAFDQYADLAAKAPEGFADVPALGQALCQEALGQTDAALAAYTAFVAEKPDSPHAFAARLGMARVTALKGDVAGALKTLADLKLAQTDESLKARVTVTEDAVKRLGK